jgi:uracil-DNA glycosylase family 4
VPAGAGWPGDPARADTPVAAGPDDVRRLAASAADLTTLDARVSVCRACPRLVGWREQVAADKRRAYADQAYWGRPVPSWGDPAAGLLVVGLAPAAHGGNRTGRIFTGDRSGDWIFAALHRAGLARLPTSTTAGDGQQLTGVRIAAGVHCAPPGNRPDPAERETCGAWLDREVQLLQPGLRAVLALGAFAWQVTRSCARRLGWAAPAGGAIRFGHGAEVELAPPGGRPILLIGSYHVSQQNTFTGRLTVEMLDGVVRRAATAGR